MHKLAAVSVVQTAPELLERFAAGYEADPLYRAAAPPPGTGAPMPAAGAPAPDTGSGRRTRASSRIGSPADVEPVQIGPPGSRKQGSLWYKEVRGAYRVCVPSDNELRQMVLREAHDSILELISGWTRLSRELSKLTPGRGCRRMYEST